MSNFAWVVLVSWWVMDHFQNFNCCFHTKREASHGVGPNEGQTSPASDFSEELAFKLMTWTYVDVVYIPLNDVINGTYIFL